MRMHWQMLMPMPMLMHVHKERTSSFISVGTGVRDGRMSRRPKAQRDAIKRAGLTVAGTCGTGLYGLYVGMAHVSPLTAVIEGVTVVCVAVPVCMYVQCRNRVALEREGQRTLLIVAGLRGFRNAENLLRLQPFNSEVIADPRCGDDLLHPLLPELRPPSEAVSGASPDGCGSEPAPGGSLPQPPKNREPPRKKRAEAYAKPRSSPGKRPR